MNERRLRGAIAVLATVGAAVAGYLVYARYAGTRIACTTGGCETVQHSKYAKLAGVPVAVLGLAGYLAVLATALSARIEAAAVGAAIVLHAFSVGPALLLGLFFAADAGLNVSRMRHIADAATEQGNPA
jgi:uncharacterized membrane protein